MLNLSPNTLFAERYRLLRQLGEGGFSEVWLVHNKVAGFEQVIKIYNGIDGTGNEIFKEEFARAYHLNHAYILRATEYAIYNNQPYLVMPHIRGGSILKLIGNVSEKDIAKVMMDIGGALANIHQPIHGLVHKDIKPDNIFIGNNGNFLLGDFGISTQLRKQFKDYAEKRRKVLSSGAGLTPMAYRAPEYFESIQAETDPIIASDIWAFGATLFELATGNPPFREMGGSAQFTDAQPPDLPPHFSRGLNNVLKSCMSKTAWDRPSAKELKRLGKFYLTFGNWTTQFETFTKSFNTIDDSIPTPAWGSSGSSLSSTSNGAPTISGKKPKKNKNKRWLITSILSLVMLGAFAFFGYQNGFFGSNTPNISENDTPPISVDSTSTPDGRNEENSKKKEKGKEEQEPKSTLNPKPQPNYTADTMFEKGEKKNTIIQPRPIPPKPKPKSVQPNFFSNPFVQEEPADRQGGCEVKIKSVHLMDHETKVIIHFKDCSQVNIMSPGDPQAFLIKANNYHYRLTRVGSGIGRTGKDINIGNDKHIEFYFAPLPKGLTQFDLLEGKDQFGTWEYWNFKGVSLKKKNN